MFSSRISCSTPSLEELNLPKYWALSSEWLQRMRCNTDIQRHRPLWISCSARAAIPIPSETMPALEFRTELAFQRIPPWFPHSTIAALNPPNNLIFFLWLHRGLSQLSYFSRLELNLTVSSHHHFSQAVSPLWWTSSQKTPIAFFFVPFITAKFWTISMCSKYLRSHANCLHNCTRMQNFSIFACTCIFLSKMRAHANTLEKKVIFLEVGWDWNFENRNATVAWLHNFGLLAGGNWLCGVVAKSCQGFGYVKQQKKRTNKHWWKYWGIELSNE